MNLVKLLLLFYFCANAYATNLRCETPRQNVVIKIENNKLKIDGRFPAETIVQRSKVQGQSKTMIFHAGGDKHTLHIANKDKPSELSDYINIKSRQGHEITYPVNCEKYSLN